MKFEFNSSLIAIEIKAQLNQEKIAVPATFRKLSLKFTQTQSLHKKTDPDCCIYFSPSQVHNPYAFKKEMFFPTKPELRKDILGYDKQRMSETWKVLWITTENCSIERTLKDK